MNMDGNTCLTFAVRDEDKKMVKILLDGGANPNITDSWGHTALMIAVSKYEEYLMDQTGEDNSKDMIEILLESGADVNIRNKTGMTALEYSTHDQITELFKRAANRNIKDLKV